MDCSAGTPTDLVDDQIVHVANLQRADLRGAYLRNAKLEGAKILGANLKGATLTGAILDGIDRTQLVLVGLRDAYLDEDPA